MKRLLLIVVMLLLPASGWSGGANYWDNTPEGRQVLQDELRKGEERMERQKIEDREEERHREQMDKLQEIESKLFQQRLDRLMDESQRSLELYTSPSYP